MQQYANAQKYTHPPAHTNTRTNERVASGK